MLTTQATWLFRSDTVALFLASVQNGTAQLPSPCKHKYMPHHLCGHCDCLNAPVKADNGLTDGAIASSESNWIKRNVRIVVVDDFPAILQLVKSILNAHAGFEVVGEARDGYHAVALAEALKPDVIVLNVTMPTMSGFEAARRIRSRFPDCAIVILSSHKDEQFIAEARKAGARGYIEKSDADEQLIRAIESAVKGEEFFVVE